MKRSLCLHHGLFCCSFIINCFRLLGMRQRIFQVDNQKDSLNLQCTHAEVCYSVFFWKLPHPYQDREGLRNSCSFWIKKAGLLFYMAHNFDQPLSCFEALWHDILMHVLLKTLITNTVNSTLQETKNTFIL